MGSPSVRGMCNTAEQSSKVSGTVFRDSELIALSKWNLQVGFDSTCQLLFIFLGYCPDMVIISIWVSSVKCLAD